MSQAECESVDELFKSWRKYKYVYTVCPYTTTTKGRGSVFSRQLAGCPLSSYVGLFGRIVITTHHIAVLLYGYCTQQRYRISVITLVTLSSAQTERFVGEAVWCYLVDRTCTSQGNSC